ncbi:MAG: putative ATP-dependent endonuclease of the family [Thermoplasmata archaeon]|nr:putative ATP-dependent endonuclease of the family [Thermoplasmata archaeon]
MLEFLVRQLELDSNVEEIELTLSLHQESAKTGIVKTVQCKGRDYQGTAAEEVFKRFRTSSALIFHNSTQPPLPWDPLRFQGALRELTPESRQVLDSLRKYTSSKMSKIARYQEESVEDLLSSLGTDMKVTLTIGGGEWTHLPYELRLGDSKMDVELHEWGSGTKNRTHILLALFRAQQLSKAAHGAEKLTPVVIIEEPESFLHPGGQASFGRTVQELAEKFDVQVIVTTHSPYMLNRTMPSSNILLQRQLRRKKVRETVPVLAEGNNWMLPYAETLALEMESFAPWQDFFTSPKEDIILVEGATDKEYLEILKSPVHAQNALQWAGAIMAYDGWTNLQTGIFLRFLKQRSRKLIVTADLDVKAKLSRCLESLGFKEGQDCFFIGVNQEGLENIEGLIPASIRSTVYAANPDIVAKLASANAEIRNEAKALIKKRLLEAFKLNARPSTEDFREFYKLAKMLNRATREFSAASDSVDSGFESPRPVARLKSTKKATAATAKKIIN